MPVMLAIRTVQWNWKF